MSSETWQPEPHLITMVAGRPPISSCTCGWKTEASENLYDLGLQAFNHRTETGHQLRGQG